MPFLQNCPHLAPLSCMAAARELFIKKFETSSLCFQVCPLIFAVRIEETGHSFQMSMSKKLCKSIWELKQASLAECGIFPGVIPEMSTYRSFIHRIHPAVCIYHQCTVRVCSIRSTVFELLVCSAFAVTMLCHSCQISQGRGFFLCFIRVGFIPRFKIKVIAFCLTIPFQALKTVTSGSDALIVC